MTGHMGRKEREMAMAHGCVSRLFLSACVVDRGRMDWDWSLVTHPEASPSEEVALGTSSRPGPPSRALLPGNGWVVADWHRPAVVDRSQTLTQCLFFLQLRVYLVGEKV